MKTVPGFTRTSETQCQGESFWDWTWLCVENTNDGSLSAELGITCNGCVKLKQDLIAGGNRSQVICDYCFEG